MMQPKVPKTVTIPDRPVEYRYEDYKDVSSVQRQADQEARNEAATAADQEMQRRRRMQSSTLVTSPLGITSPATVNRTNLLGG